MGIQGVTPYLFRNNKIARLTESEHNGPDSIRDVKWNDELTLSAALWPDFIGRTLWRPGDFWRLSNYFLCAVELVLEGDMEVELDGELTVIGPNQIYLVHCGSDSIVRTGPSGYCRKIAAGFRGPLLFPTLIANSLSDKKLIPCPDPETVYRKLQNLEELLTRRDPAEIPAVIGRSVEFFCYLRQEEKTFREQRLAEALLLLESCVPRKTRVTEIAKALSISTSTLNRMFLAHFGKPAERCLQERKMHAAAQLLRSNRKLHIKEIAQKVGYTDQGQFYRRFQAFFGCSPQTFRCLP